MKYNAALFKKKERRENVENDRPLLMQDVASYGPDEGGIGGIRGKASEQKDFQ
jgi:hypothetical protein